MISTKSRWSFFQPTHPRSDNYDDNDDNYDDDDDDNYDDDEEEELDDAIV